ncbi:MAG: elongation factor G [Chloroflexi bacterium]|nr:elongation factor G [Chloroflexota bacterium]
MAAVDPAQIRNLALMSHGGAGKTSLVEALAFAAGAISRHGRVEDHNTVADFDEDEHRREMSINASVVTFDHGGALLNLVDTPGYADFVGEMIAGAIAADVALILVDAASGVQVGTEMAWRIAQRRPMPTVVVVSRLDRENASWEGALASIQETLGNQCQPLQIPIGVEGGLEGVVDVLSGRAFMGDDGKGEDAPEAMAEAVAEAREAVVERIAESDDELTLKFLEGEELTEDEITNGLKGAIRAGTLVPVVATSATREIGVRPLLELIATELPAPNEVSPRTVSLNGPDGELAADPDGPVVAQIFKTLADDFVGRLSYFRVLSGMFTSDVHLTNAANGENERPANLSRLLGKELIRVDQLVAGEIGAVTKLAHSSTFDTLTTADSGVVVPRPAMPRPAYSAAVEPKTKADVDKLGAGLQHLTEEDKTLAVERDRDTGQTILSGLGESHVDLAADKLRRKFKVDVDLVDRRIPYRETVTTTARAEYLHKKQTGGHGQYARVALRVEPRSRGEGVEFDSECVGGSIPRNFIPAVEKGVTESLPAGVLASYPLTDLKVVVYDGKHHDVDSSEMAFRLAASQALKEAAQGARPILLEPIMMMRVTVPETATGDVMSDLNARRARVQGMEPSEELEGNTVVVAEVPMAEIRHYAAELRSMTGGRGTFTAEFQRYDPVPDHETQKVVEQARVEAETSA